MANPTARERVEKAKREYDWAHWSRSRDSERELFVALIGAYESGDLVWAEDVEQARVADAPEQSDGSLPSDAGEGPVPAEQSVPLSRVRELVEAACPYLYRAAPHEHQFDAEDRRNYERLRLALDRLCADYPEVENRG